MRYLMLYITFDIITNEKSGGSGWEEKKNIILYTSI